MITKDLPSGPYRFAWASLSLAPSFTAGPFYVRAQSPTIAIAGRGSRDGTGLGCRPGRGRGGRGSVVREIVREMTREVTKGTDRGPASFGPAWDPPAAGRPRAVVY
ncbi:hypothetical protein GCM10010387_60890 [Streptomyces inusitatus]|uniref:Uncharacterized protein n=1 Tax=Streptomyces inusitatus TaxID=68221 RepID=A0A918QNC8_9ACTN|nr:hypothetical protein GCM10010387_60890 [Streptomyces inusitatus]